MLRARELSMQDTLSNVRQTLGDVISYLWLLVPPANTIICRLGTGAAGMVAAKGNVVGMVCSTSLSRTSNITACTFDKSHITLTNTLKLTT